MKTSELIKSVNRLQFSSEFMIMKRPYEIAVSLYDVKKGIPLIIVEEDMIEICCEDKFSIDSDLGNCYKLMFEYANTPLAEREEEKKYRLKMPKEFNAGGLYVLKQDDIENYFFKACHFENAQSVFTQKEIDDMPFDTKFFIKEEVKWKIG